MPRPGSAVDGHVPTYQFQPLSHTDQAEAAAGSGGRETETLPRIADHKIDGAVRSRQTDLETIHPAVFGRVVERLLENSKEAERDVRRQAVRHVTGREIDLHVLLSGELVAKASHCHRQAQQLEFRGVQLMREGLEIGGDLHGLLLQVDRRVFVTQAGCPVREAVQRDRQHGETLADVVVKLSGDPRPFFLLCVEQPAAQAGDGPRRPVLLGDIPDDFGDTYQSAGRVRERCEGQRHTDPLPCFRHPRRLVTIDPFSGSEPLEQLGSLPPRAPEAMSMAAGWPTASASAKPKIRCAAAFQLRTMPSRLLEKIASSDDSMMAARRRRASIGRLFADELLAVAVRPFPFGDHRPQSQTRDREHREEHVQEHRVDE